MNLSLLDPLLGAGQVSSPFGYRIHPILKIRKMHEGVDLRAPSGTPVYAAADGVVERAVPNGTGASGNYVSVLHTDPDTGDSYKTQYLHLSRVDVAAGQEVMEGDLVGLVGSTGRSTGPHLHFNVRKADNTPVDPLPFINRTVPLDNPWLWVAVAGAVSMMGVLVVVTHRRRQRRLRLLQSSE